MKPVSTEQLRKLLLIASVCVSGVNTTAHWKDKAVECLENTTIHAVANLIEWVGMALEEGAYSQDKMSDPACKPPLPTLSTSAKVTKQMAYMQDTTVLVG